MLFRSEVTRDKGRKRIKYMLKVTLFTKLLLVINHRFKSLFIFLAVKIDYNRENFQKVLFT